MLLCNTGKVLFQTAQSGGPQCAYFRIDRGVLNWRQYHNDGAALGKAAKPQAAGMLLEEAKAAEDANMATPRAVAPAEPKELQDMWEWCDCGSGTHSLRVWPAGDETQAVQISSDSPLQWLVWHSHVSSVMWLCDGMTDAQTSTFPVAMRIWSASVSVQSKSMCWREGQASGRLHLQGWHDAAVSYGARGPLNLVEGEKGVDWCECGTGTQSLRIWPKGKADEAITVGFGTLLAWSSPVSAIMWQCDSMLESQTTYFKMPVRVWSVQRRTVDVKFMTCLHDTGRISWAGFREDDEVLPVDGQCPDWSPAEAELMDASIALAANATRRECEERAASTEYYPERTAPYFVRMVACVALLCICAILLTSTAAEGMGGPRVERLAISESSARDITPQSCNALEAEDGADAEAEDDNASEHAE